MSLTLRFEDKNEGLRIAILVSDCLKDMWLPKKDGAKESVVIVLTFASHIRE